MKKCLKCTFEIRQQDLEMPVFVKSKDIDYIVKIAAFAVNVSPESVLTRCNDSRLVAARAWVYWCFREKSVNPKEVAKLIKWSHPVIYRALIRLDGFLDHKDKKTVKQHKRLQYITNVI